MKKLFGFIFIFSFIIAFPIKAETLVDGIFNYEITPSKEVRILGFTSEAIREWQDRMSMPDEIMIPHEINGLPVTEIADYAFYMNREDWHFEMLIPIINNVTLPDTLKRIGHYSFSGNWLTEIKLPEGLVEIGNYAFERTSIHELVLPNSIQKIGIYIVQETHVTKLDLPKQLLIANEKTAGDLKYVIFTRDGKKEVRITGFNRKTNKQTLTVPEKIDNKMVTEIGDYAFSDANPLNPIGSGRTNLQQVTLPSTIQKVGDYAFYERGMKGDLELLNVWSIGTSAFEKNKLTAITVSDALTNLGKHAFQENELATVKLGNGLTVIEAGVFYQNKIVHLTLPKQLKKIEKEAFALNELKKLVLPEGVEKLGAYSFLANAIQTVDLPETLTVIDEGAFLGNELTAIELPSVLQEITNTMLYGNKLTTLTIPSSVTKIGERALGDNMLQKLTIPNTVQSIGEYAFNNNDLREVALSENLEVISAGVFYENKLQTIQLPKSVKAIESQAFAKNEFTQAVFPEGIEVITDAFAENKLTELIIPESVQTVEVGAFKGNKLVKVTILAPLKVIEEGVFANNQLREVHLPATVKKIGSAAFYSNKLEKITLPTAIEKIDSEAFRENKLATLSIPSSVKVIAYEAFADNELKEVEFSQGLQEIGPRAFLNNQLQAVTIPNSVKKVEFHAFKNNQLKVVNLPNSIERLESNTFKNNELTNIELPDSIISIEASVFADNPLISLTVPKNVERFALHAVVDTDVDVIYFEGEKAKIDRGYLYEPEQFKRQFGPLYKDAQHTIVWNDWGKAVGAGPLYVTWKDASGAPGEPATPTPNVPKPVETTKKFKDTGNHWAKTTIDDFVARGIISGYPDGTFRPNEPMKRKHVAAIMAKVYDLQATRPAATFSDVKPTHPNYAAILELQQAGVIHGSNGKFRPEETLTRGQMAKILVLASGFTPGGNTTFSDITPSYWGYDYVTTLADLGVVGGDNGKYKPNAPVTRGQFVGMLDKALKAME